MNKYRKTIRASFLSSEAKGDPFDRLARATVGEWDEAKHRHISPEEVALLNSLEIPGCPYCGSASFVCWGRTRHGVRRYRCKSCLETFGPLTGTLFDSHKIAVSEWMEYLINLCSFESMRQSGFTNMNADSTGRYWGIKVFAAVDGVQDDVVLRGVVWVDETYFAETPAGTVMVDGSRLRGLSRNCLCVATACDGENVVLVHCGRGKPSGRRIVEALGRHIAPGSHVVHDGELSHRALIRSLGCTDEVHDSASTKGLDDRDNPMATVNSAHRFLKLFMSRHGGFDREFIQGWLNVFHLVFKHKGKVDEFVADVLKRAISCRKVLRYRKVMKKKRGKMGT